MLATKTFGVLLWILSFVSSQESVKSRHPQLLYESKIYRILSGGGKSTYKCILVPRSLIDPPSVGIPNLNWYGVEGDYNVMVIELLGPR